MLKRDAGFTLIEIVLVLALAGLIMVIVFLAASGSQKARRDAHRKSDLARLSSWITTYAASNKGVYPTNLQVATSTSAFRTSFNTSTLRDPLAGQPYVISSDFSACDPSAAYNAYGPGYISYTKPGNNGSQFTLRICLENGDLTIDQ